MESQETGKHHNRLAFEKSPYLLQHADNPVDWYPWKAEAFEKAQRENKPVFLSIGYSTCHWCHVMAHESFENPEVAKLMNETFISVKVDREERPDIDAVYMTVCQGMTGGGGWPLTIIMTPDKRPFFAATYIPRESRFGQAGMMELISRIRELWTTRQDEVTKAAGEIVTILQQSAPEASGIELEESTLHLAYEQLSRSFDHQHGGFGDRPKFPTPHHFTFLLRYWKRTGNEKALHMVERSLQAMRLGGIYDHLGFGFHRYSTDSRWLVPHFEKMLYDQAMLAMAYTEAYQATGKEEYERTSREIFTYVLRHMTAPEGGFYCAEDADSEGQEGRFYLWTKAEIRQILDSEEADLAITVFNIEEGGNFAEESTGKRDGSNILYLRKSLKEISSELKISEQEIEERLSSIRSKLFAHREKRIHPHKDDKILTDWNGLMIAALAKGAQVFNESKYTEAARRAADFILTTLRPSDGRLLHRYRDREAAISSCLGDYAFLIWGLLELYEATFEVSYLKNAIDLNRDLLEHFWDQSNGGFYSAPDDGERLLIRQKEIYDGALPSGNSVAMTNLLRLGRITANHELEEKAARLGSTFSRDVKTSPIAYTHLMAAVDFAVGPSYEIIISGDSQADDTEAMIKTLRTCFLPNKVVLLYPREKESPEIRQLAKFISGLSRSIDGKATAYVCSDYSCNLATADINKMLELLKEQ